MYTIQINKSEQNEEGRASSGTIRSCSKILSKFFHDAAYLVNVAIRFTDSA